MPILIRYKNIPSWLGWYIWPFSPNCQCLTLFHFFIFGSMTTALVLLATSLAKRLFCRRNEKKRTFLSFFMVVITPPFFDHGKTFMVIITTKLNIFKPELSSICSKSHLEATTQVWISSTRNSRF